MFGCSAFLFSVDYKSIRLPEVGHTNELVYRRLCRAPRATGLCFSGKLAELPGITWQQGAFPESGLEQGPGHEQGFVAGFDFAAELGFFERFENSPDFGAWLDTELLHQVIAV